ncbi:MAG: hypothetical protein SGI96_09465 [Bacteroidota bacterium]|nr:hypothetical protein [Bacteroidota bacterium]
MRTITKKITILFFLLLGFVPLLFVLFITIRKYDIHKRMKEKLESQHLQTIIIQENVVTWMDKHEIWVNNSMFDIHTKKLENGICTFTGLYDDDETILVEQERNAAGKNNEQTKLLVQLFKCLPAFCNEHSEIHNPLSEHDCYSPLISPMPTSQFREILTPPPQC